MTTQIILASASPARAKLLKDAQIPHVVAISGVDEEDEKYSTLSPSQLVGILAMAKAQAVAGQNSDAKALVIGADSTLEFQGRAMAKPQTPDVAIAWWRNYVGKTGLLHTGQVVIDTSNGKTVSALSTTEITFADLSEDEILDYVATTEPLHLAGGASLDGIGSPYIAHISGDATGVLGLSMNHLRIQCAELGYPWHSLRVKP